MRTVVVGLVCMLVACGESSSDSNDSTGAGGSTGSGGTGAGGSSTGAGGSSSGGSGGGGTGGSGGSGGGSSGSTGTGGTGGGIASGGMLAGDCAPGFANLGAAFAPDPNGSLPGALSVTADNLELFHANNGTEIAVRKRNSTTEAFSEPTPALTYATLCPSVDPNIYNVAIDVSGNGLRIYFTCMDGEGPVGLAERPDRDSPFVVAPDPVGTAGTSVSISGDELTLYSATVNGPGALVLRSERQSITDTFGPATRVAELTGEFRHPEISADGLNLFGLVLAPTEPAGSTWQLAVATRQSPTDMFSQPSSGGLPVLPPLSSDYTPTVSGDCSSLYFLRLVNTASGSSGTAYVALR